MYELNKTQFGAFVAALRKAQGMTQRELAQRLQISDKAVSKWETGVSIPDTALLVPLAEALGVTVTELLRGKRLDKSITPEEAEDLVQAVISCGEGQRAWQERSLWKPGYGLALAAGAVLAWLNWRQGLLTESLAACMAVTAAFGAYFTFFAQLRLPGYYDRNAIGAFSDGPVRMNLPGVRFTNRNWPHILKAARLGTAAALPALPLLTLALGALGLWTVWAEKLLVFITLAALFVPMYITGWKHQ
ncbi:MAG: helix-turn-helix transcriptional regulator [Eubacteriales bacterium]|nr:helix-turn-helix transcriptional regulator [Eubacteriales bacterium]